MLFPSGSKSGRIFHCKNLHVFLCFFSFSACLFVFVLVACSNNSQLDFVLHFFVSKEMFVVMTGMILKCFNLHYSTAMQFPFIFFIR